MAKDNQGPFPGGQHWQTSLVHCHLVPLTPLARTRNPEGYADDNLTKTGYVGAVSTVPTSTLMLPVLLSRMQFWLVAARNGPRLRYFQC